MNGRPRGADARQIPEFGAGLQAVLRPKPDVVVLNRGQATVQDGQITVWRGQIHKMLLDPGTRVQWKEDPLDEELWDLVVVLQAHHVQRPTSVILAEGTQLQGVSMGLLELGRWDLKEFKGRCRAVMAGQAYDEYLSDHKLQRAVDNFLAAPTQS